MFYSRGKAASKAVTINLINSPDVRSRHSLLRRTCPLSGGKADILFCTAGQCRWDLSSRRRLYRPSLDRGKTARAGSAVIEIRDVHQPKDPRALGITVPPGLGIAADEVVEFS